MAGSFAMCNPSVLTEYWFNPIFYASEPNYPCNSHKDSEENSAKTHNRFSL